MLVLEGRSLLLTLGALEYDVYSTITLFSLELQMFRIWILLPLRSLA